MGTPRPRDYRAEAFKEHPPWCHVCHVSGVRLQAHHVQELADNGDPYWTVLLCVPHHREVTVKRGPVSSTKAKSKKKPEPVKPDPSPVATMLGLLMVLGALGYVGWMIGYQRQVAIAGGGVVGLLVVWALVSWWVGRRRRAMETLRVQVARAAKTMPTMLKVSRVGWGWVPLEQGQVGVGDAFDMRPGSKDITAVEDTVRHLADRDDLWFGWNPRKRTVRWTLLADDGSAPAVGQPEPDDAADDKRDAVVARLRQGVQATLHPAADVTVNRWVGNHPAEFTISHTADAPTQKAAVQDAVEDKITALFKPVETWRFQWDTHGDTVRVTDIPDPLKDVVTPRPLGSPVNLAAVHMGVRNDHKPFLLPLYTKDNGPAHILIAGATGAGKGSVIWSLTWELAAAAQQGTVRLWGCDPKSGMELGKGRDLWDRYESEVPKIADMLEDAVKEMKDRGERLAAAKIRLLVPTVDEPLTVIVIDEIAELTAYTDDPKLKKRLSSTINLLLSQGRAMGFCVIGAVQDPRAEVLNMRRHFQYRICLRVGDAGDPDMVLGKGARNRGARADRIPRSQPDGTTTAGIGYVATEDGMPVRFRVPYVTDADIAALEKLLSPTAVVDEGPVLQLADPTDQERWEQARPLELSTDDVLLVDDNGVETRVVFDCLDDEDGGDTVGMNYRDAATGEPGYRLVSLRGDMFLRLV